MESKLFLTKKDSDGWMRVVGHEVIEDGSVIDRVLYDKPDPDIEPPSPFERKDAASTAPEWKRYRLRGERWECEVADIADGCLPLVCVKGGIHTGTRVRLDGRVLDALFEVVYMGRINLRAPTIEACRTTGGIMPGTVIVPAGQSETNTYDVRKPPSEAEGGELFYRIPADTFLALFEEAGELPDATVTIPKGVTDKMKDEFIERFAPSPPDAVDWDFVQKISTWDWSDEWPMARAAQSAVFLARALLELRERMNATDLALRVYTDMDEKRAKESMDRLDNLDKWCAKAMEIWHHMPTHEDLDGAVEGYNKLEDRLDGLYQSLRNHNHGNRFKKLEGTLEEMQGKLSRAVGDKTCITIDLEPGQAAELVSLIERHIEK